MLINSQKLTSFSALFKQICAPTVVTHSVFCNVLHPKNRNLVLIRGNCVEIYDIILENGSAKFSFVTNTNMNEEIRDIAVVRFYGDQLDSLLLSFREAKVAAMNFDIHSYELKTCSLHTYENPSLKGGRLQFTKPPLLRVDPLQRCAVMLVYDRYLAVLPFRRADALSSSEQIVEASTTPTTDAAWQHKATAPILSTFTTFLSTSTGERINNVIDLKFLYGFYEPTLLVLYEPVGTWAGRVSARRDTCCIVALSLNLQKRTNPVIWFQEFLPYDCHTVLPIPMPVGGVVLIANNSIIYLKQTLPSCGLPLNCYAKSSTNFPLRQEIPNFGPISLDCCCVQLLNNTQVLIAARTGNFYILTFWLENATNTVTNLLLSEAGSFVPAECITLLNNNYLFVGSCLSDSLLLRYILTSECFTSPSKILNQLSLSFFSEDTIKESPAKCAKLESSSDIEVAPASIDNTCPLDEIDVDLYGRSALQSRSHSLDVNMYHFEVLDSLRNIGPMACITAGELPCLATGHTDPSDELLSAAQSEMAHIELIAAINRPPTKCLQGLTDTGGGIALLHRSVRASGLTAFELPEYNSLWSLYGPPLISSNDSTIGTPLKEAEPKPRNNDLLTGSSNNPEDESESTKLETHKTDEIIENEINQKTETIKQDDECSTLDSANNIDKRKFHSYLLLTREDSTMILEVGEEIVELEVSGFNTSETTLLAANLGMNSLRDSNKQTDNSIQSEQPHAFSNDISIGNEISKTLHVGLDYPYILQLSPTSLRLLDGPRLLEHLQLTTEWRIYLASASDPYVLVGTEDDDLILISLRQNPIMGEIAYNYVHPTIQPNPIECHSSESNTEDTLPFSNFLHLSRPKVAQVSAPICFCLYHDTAGRLARWLNFSNFTNTNLLWMANQAEAKRKTDDAEDTVQLSALDEEDILLYGEVIDTLKKEKVCPEKPVETPSSDNEDQSPVIDDNTSPSSLYFAFIVFSNGVLEIYSVPDFVCLYEVQQFSDLPPLIFDNRWIADKVVSRQARIKSLLLEGDELPPTIREICVFPMGREMDRAVLFVRTTQEVVCYEALCPKTGEAVPLTPVNSKIPGISPLRWRRLPLACPLLVPRRLRCDPRITELHSKLHSKTTMLRPFEDIGGHRGVFVCGSQPTWLFCSRMGHIRIFPHSIDGILTSFAPLNTAMCPNGFVYFTHSNEMRLATLSVGYSYEEELGIRTIPLDSCPHFIQYHLESKTYVVVSSVDSPCTLLFRLNAEGNKEEETVERPPDCVFPTIANYKLQVFASPSSSPTQAADWELVPNSVIEFEPFEIVTCLVTAQLASEQTFHGTKDYIAIGSNLSYGEEIPVRGRIVLIDIIEVVPEPGQPLTRHKVKTVFDGDQKGPVTALASCQGHLIGAVGQKIYIWTLKNADLVGVAFVDTDLYIHTLLCAKNLVLAADVLKSIQLLRFQANLRVLSLVSRDSSSRDIFAANFFVDGSKLGFIITDKCGNLVVYSYDPMEMSSCAGRRLVSRVDMRLPSRATSCLRIANRFRHPLLLARSMNVESSSEVEKRTAPGQTNLAPRTQSAATGLLSSIEVERSRHSVYFGSQIGAIYLITPIRDKMLSRFRIIEKNLVQYVGCVAGLTPRVCRQYANPSPELSNPCGNVADGDLIWRYLSLPHAQRLEVAKKSGQSLDSILDDIAEVSAITLHF